MRAMGCVMAGCMVQRRGGVKRQSGPEGSLTRDFADLCGAGAVWGGGVSDREC